eukprot:717922_1
MKRNKRMEPPTMKNYRLAKMKGEDLRDAYAQQKFRKKLKENPQALKNLETKFGKSIDYLEASHCFSLSIAAFLIITVFAKMRFCKKYDTSPSTDSRGIRLFYCCFQSSKGRIVWDDHRN